MSFVDLPDDIKLIVAHASPFVPYRIVSHSVSKLLEYAPMACISEVELLNKIDPVEFNDAFINHQFVFYDRVINKVMKPVDSTMSKLDDEVTIMLSPLTTFRRIPCEMRKRAPCFVNISEACKAAWKVIERISTLIKCTHIVNLNSNDQGCWGQFHGSHPLLPFHHLDDPTVSRMKPWSIGSESLFGEFREIFAQPGQMSIIVILISRSTDSPFDTFIRIRIAWDRRCYITSSDV